MIRFRPLPGMTFWALPALLVLVGLGVWQVQRLHEKEELLITLAERMKAAETAVDDVLRLPLAEMEWRRVQAHGRFLHDKDISSTGLGPLGVEHVAQKGFVCRGVLLDAVALRGATLPVPKENSASDPGIVTAKDVQAMVERQGLAPIGVGDCVFLYTGHGDLWHPRDWDKFDAAEKAKRIAQFNAGEPGFGISACEYLAERKIILTGADNWATEAVGKGFGGENPQPFECHAKLQTKRGIWNIENLDLSQLVADKAYEFLFVWSPLKMKGATGSPGNPVALY